VPHQAHMGSAAINRTNQTGSMLLQSGTDGLVEKFGKVYYEEIDQLWSTCSCPPISTAVQYMSSMFRKSPHILAVGSRLASTSSTTDSLTAKSAATYNKRTSAGRL
jgi:hypothetical protein